MLILGYALLASALCEILISLYPTIPNQHNINMIVERPDAKEIQHYQKWEKSAALETGITRYVDYVPMQVAFRPRDEDIPRLAKGVSCARQADGDLAISCIDETSGEEGADVVVLPGYFNVKDVEIFLNAVNGEKSVKEIMQALPTKHNSSDVSELINRLAGHAILFPEEIKSLEKKVHFYEIVRIPLRSPYTVLREYWENQGSIRQYLPDLAGTLDSLSTFKSFLSDLHIIATLGSSGNNYYGGGGGIPTVPGQYRTVPIGTGTSATMVDFITSELRTLRYNYPTRIDKTLKSKRDRVVGYSLNSGTSHHHHYDGVEDMDDKLDELREYLWIVQNSCKSGETRTAIINLSNFHWLFSQMHPFANINNSIAMNIINNYLKSMNLGSIPHLFLDYFAQRTGQIVYERVFSSCVEEFSFPGNKDAEENGVYKKTKAYYFRFKSIRTPHG